MTVRGPTVQVHPLGYGNFGRTLRAWTKQDVYTLGPKPSDHCGDRVRWEPSTLTSVLTCGPH